MVTAGKAPNVRIRQQVVRHMVYLVDIGEMPYY